MAYIIVLNPLIIGTQADADGKFLGGGTAPNLPLVYANFPLALATGLGLNAFVTFAIAKQMTWADAMGLVVIEGVIITVLVLSGLRKAVFNAVPAELKVAISVGIGLFIAFIGVVDAGFVRRPVPCSWTPGSCAAPRLRPCRSNSASVACSPAGRCWCSWSGWSRWS